MQMFLQSPPPSLSLSHPDKMLRENNKQLKNKHEKLQKYKFNSKSNLKKCVNSVWGGVAAAL